MQTLPVTPVETLATALRTAEFQRNDNPGIVPPFIERNGDKNPGIVPPWLQRTDKNPGIVPPWLLPVAPDEPVDADTPRILNAQVATGFDPAPVR